MQYKKLWIALTLVVLVAEFLQTDLMNQLRWLRTIGDTIFAVGALLLGWFVLGLVTGHSYDERGTVAPGEAAIRPNTGTS